jgi:hypothetical protein
MHLCAVLGKVTCATYLQRLQLVKALQQSSVAIQGLHATRARDSSSKELTNSPALSSHSFSKLKQVQHLTQSHSFGSLDYVGGRIVIMQDHHVNPAIHPSDQILLKIAHVS